MRQASGQPARMPIQRGPGWRARRAWRAGRDLLAASTAPQCARDRPRAQDPTPTPPCSHCVRTSTDGPGCSSAPPTARVVPHSPPMCVGPSISRPSNTSRRRAGAEDDAEHEARPPRRHRRPRTRRSSWRRWRGGRSAQVRLEVAGEGPAVEPRRVGVLDESSSRRDFTGVPRPKSTRGGSRFGVGDQPTDGVSVAEQSSRAGHALVRQHAAVRSRATPVILVPLR